MCFSYVSENLGLEVEKISNLNGGKSTESHTICILSLLLKSVASVSAILQSGEAEGFLVVFHPHTSVTSAFCTRHTHTHGGA